MRSVRSLRGWKWLALVAIGALVGCGSATDGDAVLEAQENGQPLGAEERLIERRLVTDKDTREAPDGTAQRAFLEYWAAISFEDWRTAIEFVAPSLRQAFDPGYLVRAVRIEGQNSVPVKPLVRGVQRTRGGTTIRYFVRTGDARLRPTSSTWTKQNGWWYLTYSATLDDSYAAAVQQGVQTEVNPNAKVASRRALREAARASRLQARTLQP